MREAERIRIWENFGLATMVAYIEATLGDSAHTAYERLRMARSLERLPDIEDALGRGELSPCVVRELTRVVIPETQSAWLTAARGKTTRDVQHMVATHAPGDLPSDAEKPNLRPRHLHLELSPDTYALFRRAKRTIEEELGQSLDDDEFMRTILERGLQPKESSTKPPFQIAVTECKSCGRTWQDDVEVDQHVREEAECDAEYIGCPESNVPVRARRSIPPAIRRLVIRRDKGRCQFPGCNSQKNLHIHHIDWDPSSNDPSNLMLCCGGHHRMVHRRKIFIRGTMPDGLICGECTPVRCETNTPGDEVQPAIAETKIAPNAEAAPANTETDTTAEPSEDIAVVAFKSLVLMGFKKHEATIMMKSAMSHVGPTTLEDLIKRALRAMPKLGKTGSS